MSNPREHRCHYNRFSNLRRATAGDMRDFFHFVPDSILVIDTETTGLDPMFCDILEAAAVDGGGKTVAEHRYGSYSTEWPEAEAIHGISPEDVEGLRPFDEDVDRWTDLISEYDVVAGYNVQFDIGFMASAGVDFGNVKVYDVMEPFAVIYGQWNEYWDSYTWKKLVDAAEYYGLPIDGAHGALWDARTALKVMRRTLGFNR